jgi:hypothetical protein
MAIKTASGSGLSNSLSSGLVLLNTTSFSGVASQSFLGYKPHTTVTFVVNMLVLVISMTQLMMCLEHRKKI